MRTDRGSVLMLVPAAILVLVILGAIAVDSSVVLLGQRELANAAAAAANDAATVALDLDRLRTKDEFVLDPSKVDAVARQAAMRQTDAVEVGPDDVQVSVEGLQVTVRLSGTVQHIFARGVPGARRTSRVSATATAELRAP